MSGGLEQPKLYLFELKSNRDRMERVGDLPRFKFRRTGAVKCFLGDLPYIEMIVTASINGHLCGAIAFLSNRNMWRLHD